MTDQELKRNRLLGLGLALVLGGVCAGIALFSQVPPVYATNGLNKPMLLRLDGQEFSLAAVDWQRLEGLSQGTEHAQFSLDQGQSWTTMPVDLSSGPRVVVINPYGAARVYSQRIVYSQSGQFESFAPQYHCGKPLLRVSRADYFFEPLPDQMENWGSSKTLTREWLDMGGGVEDCIAEFSATGALSKAVLLAKADLDPAIEASVLRLERLQAQVLSPSEYSAWLASSAQDPGGLTFKTFHQQWVLQGDHAQEYLLALEERHHADPSEPETAYLYAMTLEGPEALAVMKGAHQAHPEYLPLNRVMALHYEKHGEPELALPLIERLSTSSEFKTIGPLWSAQIYTRLGRVTEAEAALSQYAQSDIFAASALVRLQGQISPQLHTAWRNQTGLSWLEIWAGGPDRPFEDPFLRLNNQILNGPTEALFSNRYAQDPELVSALGDSELMLLHALAIRENSAGVERVTREALDQRPVLLQALADPYAPSTEELDLSSFAVACLHQLWNGDLDPEKSKEMQANVKYYDSFGMMSAKAGWPTATTDATSVPPD
jgi:hypothetical protein